MQHQRCLGLLHTYRRLITHLSPGQLSPFRGLAAYDSTPVGGQGMPRKRTVAATFDRIRQETRLLYDWLREHHDDFAAELDRTRVRDRWKLAMKLIAHHQLLGNDNEFRPTCADEFWPPSGS
jgi:hypothetical protein